MLIIMLATPITIMNMRVVIIRLMKKRICNMMIHWSNKSNSNLIGCQHKCTLIKSWILFKTTKPRIIHSFKTIKDRVTRTILLMIVTTVKNHWNKPTEITLVFRIFMAYLILINLITLSKCKSKGLTKFKIWYKTRILNSWDREFIPLLMILNNESIMHLQYHNLLEKMFLSTQKIFWMMMVQPNLNYKTQLKKNSKWEWKKKIWNQTDCSKMMLRAKLASLWLQACASTWSKLGRNKNISYFNKKKKDCRNKKTKKKSSWWRKITFIKM